MMGRQSCVARLLLSSASAKSSHTGSLHAARTSDPGLLHVVSPVPGWQRRSCQSCLGKRLGQRASPASIDSAVPTPATPPSTLQGGQLDPNTKRAVKIERFKMEKALSAQLSVLEGQRSKAQELELREQVCACWFQEEWLCSCLR